jgi:Domain of unknown function (DUF1906)
MGALWRGQGPGGTGRRIAAALLAVGLCAGVVLPAAAPAAANPATTAGYPAGSSATRTGGLGFDTCTAPSAAALAAWRAAPYRTVNIYFAGINRGCKQPELTAAWVRDVSAAGWRLLPTFMGRQPSCIFGTKPHRYTAEDAAAWGTEEARVAAIGAAELGLLPGSALYADVEHYDRADRPCVTAVRRYVSAWTARLHAAGYLAGVYVHQDSGLRDLSGVYGSPDYARPDAVWMARWDGDPALTGWPTAPDTHWGAHQRIKQYRGDHTETWGGVTIAIDSDSLDAPVATVAYRYRVTSSTPLNSRSGPTSSHPVVGVHAPGATLAVVCQGAGQRVGSTAVWDRLTDGSWVSDAFVSTPSATTWSPPLPRCSYPGQVTAAAGLSTRTGPSMATPVAGPPLPYGGLAYVVCQLAGDPVGTSRIWNLIDDGRWVSDYYVQNRSNTKGSAPVPRCP